MTNADATSHIRVPTARRFRLSIRTMLLLVGCISIVIWLVHSLYAAYQSPWNSYAKMNVAEAVIGHMRAHDGSWPRDWADIEIAFESMYQGTGAITFEELKNRVEIDFDVDPDQLREKSLRGIPFNVIRSRSGQTAYWAGAEPNDVIRKYLLRIAK